MARRCIMLGLAVMSTAQYMSITPQSNTFNSSFSLSADQVNGVGFNHTVAHNVDVAVRFERTNWATDSEQADPFYAAPAGFDSKPAGSLLRLEG